MKLNNKRNKTIYSNQKGITLIALVITIVVLLILAGVSINAIFSENGIIKKAQDAQNKMDQATQNDLDAINSLSNWIDSKTNGNTGGEDNPSTPSEIEPSDYIWTQNKTTVTGTSKSSGTTITREVGTNFTYNCGVSGYTGGWKVLGADEGKLLIMSTVDVGTLSLSGGEGYNTGISQLDTMCAPYGTEARSITVEDINRVTGYTPAHQTITITSENKYYYDDDQTNQQSTNGSSKYKYADMASKLGITDSSITGKVNYYYYPSTLTTSDGEQIGEIGISKASLAYKLLFRNTADSANCSYWLASSYVCADSYRSYFGLHDVDSEGRVLYCSLWHSSRGAGSFSYGVRAVVSL